MRISVGQLYGTMNPREIRITCPNCKKLVYLESFGPTDASFQSNDNIMVTASLRRCPDSLCHQLVFVVSGPNNLLTSFPITELDFDTSSIPESITICFQEALKCRSNELYIAAGIMIRKTLEVLCEDLAILGKDLNTRLKNISSRVTLPVELIEGMNDIRLLGNDAAHIESKTYIDISHEEIDVAIELVKEILKGVYQYNDLIKRIRALQKP